MTDLWPEDIRVVKEKAPVTILREQASLLGQKTKNIVTAEVRPVEVLDGPEFAFAFYIVGPALGNYRYRLFRITHGVEFYPTKMYVRDADIMREIMPWETSPPDHVVATTRSEFLDILGRIFRSKKTGQVVTAILAQSGVELGESP